MIPLAALISHTSASTHERTERHRTTTGTALCMATRGKKWTCKFLS